MKTNVILYTTHCPLCRGVELMLKASKIDYKEITSVDEIKAKGISHVPVLSVDDKLMTGKEINDWIKENRGD